jgi:Fe-Mn family superoxide dismutase
MSFSVPELPYEYNALEPVLDEETMHLHHDKHHAAYVNNLNTALEGTEWAEKPIEEVILSLNSIPEEKRMAVRNNGGGHLNHSWFWQMMRSPMANNRPSGTLADAIDSDFGSFEAFAEKFTEAATKRFGSGWAWLVKKDGKLSVTSTPNQDNPLMEDAHCVPLLGIDVWEHAYYLHYQNRRPDYIKAWWEVVNWDVVSERFES